MQPAAQVPGVAAAARKDQNNIAIAGLVCGAGAVAVAFTAITYAAFAFGVAAIVLGGTGYRRAQERPDVDNGQLGGLGAAIGVFGMLLAVVNILVVREAVDDLERSLQESSASAPVTRPFV